MVNNIDNYPNGQVEGSQGSGTGNSDPVGLVWEDVEDLGCALFGSSQFALGGRGVAKLGCQRTVVLPSAVHQQALQADKHPMYKNKVKKQK